MIDSAPDGRSWLLAVGGVPEARYREYSIASTRIVTVDGMPIPWRGERRPIDLPARGEGDPEGRLLWEGPGWLGGTWRSVRAEAVSGGYRLAIERFGTAYLDRGARVARVVPEPGLGEALPALVEEVALGPVLVLALALEETFCLHAGATRIGDAVVAWVGESGAGKSTLAEPSAEGAESWPRVSDDVLPIVGVEAAPRFPQLKLPIEALPDPTDVLEPLGAVLWLDPVRAPDAATPIVAEPLAARDATLALVRHTVGSRLFDRDLLARHLSWAEELARRVPIVRWRYPHDRERLDEVRDRIRDFLAPTR